ncbi:SMI1/KNR4 family protein [Brevundimonas sp. UBA7664]|uniref:SMI1/KNR4 family protein n=1 Tax=Brevundimonas sp. UBA7664 TaxID=1946141 RepID=UPI0025C443F3|nr:SMI1/KNR4 family protein [Brevundimonas sp. UBA7664]
MSRLERWRARGWAAHESGGLQVCHTPAVAPLAHLHWVYPGLTEDRLVETEAAYAKPMPPEYRRFLGWANGMSLFDGHLSFTGSHVVGSSRSLLDQCGVGIGMPVSLDYGNVVERPAGLPATAWAIGVISGWSGQGRLVLNQSGEIRLCSLTDFDDVAAVWSTFGEMVLGEFDRMNALTGDAGEPHAEGAEFLPEAARRWERKPQDKGSLKNPLPSPETGASNFVAGLTAERRRSAVVAAVKWRTARDPL